MAAKKAPAKKMAAPKKSGSAAQFRKAEEAGKKKQSAPKVVASSPQFVKAGKDARARASKYGTPVGPTTADATALKGQQGNWNVSSKTMVKSSRGNYYTVTETKRQNMLMPDSKPKTYIAPAKTTTTKPKGKKK
jgi:hypothetical protein